MSANQADFPIATMARVFGVSEAGFYAWRKRPASAHAVADKMLLKRVRTIHASSRQTYGWCAARACRAACRRRNGRKRIARLMRAACLVGASRRRTGVTTTRRDKDARPAPDLMDRNFVAFKPNQLWVADITSVPTASFSFTRPGRGGTLDRGGAAGGGDHDGGDGCPPCSWTGVDGGGKANGGSEASPSYSAR